MFAKRHRRQKEEEPLVPHGLVWQAMEHMGSAEKSEGKVETSNRLPGPQLVPPPIRLAPSKPPSVVNDDLSRSSTVFWKKLAKPQLFKSSTFDGGSAPPLSAADRLPTNLERPHRYLSPTVDRLKRAWDLIHLNLARSVRGPIRRLDLGGRVVKCRTFMAGLGQRAGLRLRVLPATFLKAKLWQRSKRRMVAARTITTAQAHNLSATTRHCYQKLKARSRAYLAAGELRAQADLIARETSRATQDALPAAEPAAVAVPPLHGLAPVAAQSRAQKSGAPHHDARLQTSFTMAGLLALLVLGLVSAVQHYATRALPSHLLHKNSSPAITQAHTTPADTNAPSQKSTKAKAVRASQAAAIDSPKRATGNGSVKPKRRSHEDDDYVARDTFVSYGKRPNSSH